MRRSLRRPSRGGPEWTFQIWSAISSRPARNARVSDTGERSDSSRPRLSGRLGGSADKALRIRACSTKLCGRWRSNRVAAFAAILWRPWRFTADDQRATKVSVGIVPAEGADADPLQRWFSEHEDTRAVPEIARQIGEFIEAHGAKSVVLVDHIIGCPHEEGVDYPEGATCPQCPFWANRDRWSGELLR
jgi:hypothetical protein